MRAVELSQRTVHVLDSAYSQKMKTTIDQYRRAKKKGLPKIQTRLIIQNKLPCLNLKQRP